MAEKKKKKAVDLTAEEIKSLKNQMMESDDSLVMSEFFKAPLSMICSHA